MSIFELKLKKLFLSFVLLQIVLLAVILLFFLLVTDYVHNATADITAKQFRHFYLLNDKRMATQILHSSNSNFAIFERIQFKDENKKVVINYPSEFKISSSGINNLFLKKIKVPIYFDMTDTKQIGVLQFNYNLMRYFPFWCLSYLFIGAASLFFLIREKKRLLDQISKEQEIEKNIALSKLARQVVHDIRSPISVIKSLKVDIESLPIETRQRLVASINRVEDVAHHLLSSYKDSSSSFESFLQPIHLLTMLVTSIEEKKIEYRDKKNVEFNFNFNPVSYYSFSNCSESIMRSIVSNIINNAVDVIASSEGRVEILLDESKHYNKILIEDTGPGIRKEDEEFLFNDGFSTKPNGNGVGLYTAKKYLNSWGGDISYDRTLNKTRFIISLPKEIPPKNFLFSLNLFKYKKIIVLDDDENMLKQWKILINSNDLSVYSSVNSLECDYPSKIPSDVLLISDFKLLNSKKNGIEVICSIGNVEKSILVTALSRDPGIEKQCNQLGIKLKHKDIINFIPLLERPPQIILIDDDKFVRSNWSTFCLKNGFSFSCFQSVHDFLNASIEDKNCYIFVDSSLSEDKKGEVEAEKIYEKGFRKIFLSTGFDDIDCKDYPWLMGTFSKSPELLNSLF